MINVATVAVAMLRIFMHEARRLGLMLLLTYACGKLLPVDVRRDETRTF